MNRIYVIFLALACGLSAVTASAVLTDPAQIQTEAYVNLVQADQGLDAGRLDEALSLYTAARDYYRQLADDFPGWEPRIVQYRKTYCDNQIADIKRRQDSGVPEKLPELPPWTESVPAAPAEPAPAPAPVAAAAAAPAPDRSVEIDYLKARIASLEAELAEFDTLQDELDTLTSESDRLRTALDAANQQLTERTASDETEVQKLREDLAAKDAELQSLQKNLDSKKQLDQALNDMEAKVNELRTQHDRLTEEIKTLDLELDDAEIRADQAELRATKAEKELKKARTSQAKVEKKLETAQRKADGKSKKKKKAKTKAKTKAPSEPEIVEEPMPVPVASPVMATVPPKPIPAGMTSVNFIRQLLQDGEYEAALATVQEARTQQPADRNLLLIEGITLTLLQRYTEAATLLNDLAKHNPRNAEIHGALGGAMMGAGFYDEARETLLMAVNLDKNLPECHYNLALLYAFIDPINLKSARRHYKQARELGVAADPRLDRALK